MSEKDQKVNHELILNKDFVIRIDDGALDRVEAQKTGISNKRKPLTDKINECNSLVDALDRYDDFDTLKIDTKAYVKNNNTGEYGIHYEEFGRHENNLHNEVIFPFQKEAALLFLKEHRGFGILAELVGTGKTYEAGLILSELAARNKMNSLLLIVPNQVIDSWKNVIEMEFGLGKDVIYVLDKPDFSIVKKEVSYNVVQETYRAYQRPILISLENFEKLDEQDLNNILFETIVVDEAHNLCKEDNIHSLKLLSTLMEIKNKVNSAYCLLLSATPHSGNLEGMFPLWYFVKCKGGIPSDFMNKKDQDRSLMWQEEKEKFTRVCRGASTVMQFVQHVRADEVRKLPEYQDFLKSKGFTPFKISELTKHIFPYKMSEEDKKIFIEQKKFTKEFFYELEDNSPIRKELIKKIANAYHVGVLRSIMVRQPYENIKRYIDRRRENKVIFFFPTTKWKGQEISFNSFDQNLKIDFNSASYLPDLEVKNERGKAISLEQFVKSQLEHGARDVSIHIEEVDIIHHALEALDNIDQNIDTLKDVFKKDGSLRYYNEMLRDFPLEDVYTKIIPVGLNDLSFETHIKSVLDAKIEETKKILNEHTSSNQKVLIFFDYEYELNEGIDEIEDENLQAIKALEKALKEDKRFAPRLIIGTKDNDIESCEEFSRKENCIFLAEHPKYTEGLNLQEGNIIINFQVTPNPVAMEQRIGRVIRIGQKENVEIYSLADMSSLEGYILAYFIKIGLMTGNNSDSTIIAGSNYDQKVSMICRNCGKVVLYDQDEFDERNKSNDPQENPYYCHEKSCLEINGERTMTQIVTHDFYCEKCGSTFKRNRDENSLAYSCITRNHCDMGNSGYENDRRYYCKKICVLDHCKLFRKIDCPALKAFRENKNIETGRLEMLCAACKKSTFDCPSKCRLVNKECTGKDKYIKLIEACSKCPNATCTPKPHVVQFDMDKWEAPCPMCKENHEEGKLKMQSEQTFVEYIRASWKFKQKKHDVKDEYFCDNLLSEAGNVSLIAEVLGLDNVQEE